LLLSAAHSESVTFSPLNRHIKRPCASGGIPSNGAPKVPYFCSQYPATKLTSASPTTHQQNKYTMPTTQPTAPGPNAFTDAPEVQQCLAQLREHFHAQNPLVVSDVLDEHGNQYVNLVQKGGGVLGVALVGYTYVLEQMGIRFLRLAGTSAGAINTAMMTVIDRKEDAKSEKIVKAISELDFFALVDGHPSARWLIKNFITHKDFTTKIKRWFVRTVALLFALIVADSALLSLEHHYRWLIPWTQTCFVVTGFALLALGGLLFYLNRLMNRLKNAGFGSIRATFSTTGSKVASRKTAYTMFPTSTKRPANRYLACTCGWSTPTEPPISTAT
jgi:hypothetical protein